MSRAAVIAHERYRRGLACACVNPEDLPEHQRLAAGAGVGATFSEALPGMLLVFGLPTVGGAGLGALVGGKEHRVAGSIIGGVIGLAGVFAYGIYSAAKGLQ